MSDWLSGIRARDLLRRIGGTRRDATNEDVEDAIQDVFLNVLEKLQSARPPVEPLNRNAYLTRAVHNRLNSLRRSRREVPMDPEIERKASEPGPASVVNLSPAAIHEASERTELFTALTRALMGDRAAHDEQQLTATFAALQEALREQLTDRHWILIRMRVLQGIGVVECARILQISVGTAHNWTHKALDICRQTLERFDIEPGELWYPRDEAG